MMDISKAERLHKSFPSLIPLNGKKPFQDDWQEACEKARPFNAKEHQTCNVGIPCGPANGILALDVDNVESFNQWLKEKGYSLPPTREHETGTGKPHFLFGYPQNGHRYGNRSIKNSKGEKIFDIRGIGGQIVGTGNIHPDTGLEYKVKNDCPIVPTPEWLLKVSKSEPPHNAAPLVGQTSNTDIEALPIGYGTKKLILEGETKGRRSEAIMSVLNALVRAGTNDAAIIRLFEARPQGIGEKYFEAGNTRQKWLFQQIAKVRNSRPTETKKDEVAGLGYAELRKKFSEKTEYLWMNRIPKRMPVIIAGMPGIGKTSIALGIIKEALEENPNSIAVWISTEGHTQDTLIKIGEVGGPLLESDRFQIACKKDKSFIFNFHHEWERKSLDQFLSTLTKPLLIVAIDSLRGASENIDENSKVMGDMMNRTQGYICDKHGASCVWIHHWNKKQNVSESERLSGNTSISGAVRAVYGVTGNSEFTRILKLGKNNLSDVAKDPLRVIKTDRGFIFSEITHTEETDLRRAEKLLIHLFSEAEDYATTDIYQIGEREGLSPDIMKKAKSKLPIEAYHAGVGEPWRWKGFLRGGETVTLVEKKKNVEKTLMKSARGTRGISILRISQGGQQGQGGQEGIQKKTFSLATTVKKEKAKARRKRKATRSADF